MHVKFFYIFFTAKYWITCCWIIFYFMGIHNWFIYLMKDVLIVSLASLSLGCLNLRTSSVPQSNNSVSFMLLCYVICGSTNILSTSSFTMSVIHLPSASQLSHSATLQDSTSPAVSYQVRGPWILRGPLTPPHFPRICHKSSSTLDISQKAEKWYTTEVLSRMFWCFFFDPQMRLFPRIHPLFTLLTNHTAFSLCSW